MWRLSVSVHTGVWTLKKPSFLNVHRVHTRVKFRVFPPEKVPKRNTHQNLTRKNDSLEMPPTMTGERKCQCRLCQGRVHGYLPVQQEAGAAGPALSGRPGSRPARSAETRPGAVRWGRHARTCRPRLRETEGAADLRPNFFLSHIPPQVLSARCVPGRHYAG